MNSINNMFGIPYVITVADRYDRQRRFAEAACHAGLEFEWLHAIRPDLMWWNAMTLRSTPLPTFESLLGDSELGCRLAQTGARLSHLLALQNGFFVMEDDAIFRPEWNERWQLVMDQLASPEALDYDILFLACGRERGPMNTTLYETIGPNLEILHSGFWGMHAYYCKPQGRKILTELLQKTMGLGSCDTTVSNAGLCQEARVLRIANSPFKQHDRDDSATQFRSKTRHINKEHYE